MKFRIGSVAVAVGVIGLGSGLLAGCGRLGGASTADLVQRGDANACAAPEVYSTLHDILTKPVSLSTGAEDLTPMFGRVNQLMAQSSLTFDATTLDAVDTATHSISCSAQMSGKVGAQAVAGLRVAYKVQPAANSGQIVVTVNDADDAQAPIAKAAAIASHGVLGPAEPEAAATPANTSPTIAPQGAEASTAAVAATNTTGDDGDVTHTRFGDLRVDDSQYLLLNGHRVQPAISGNNSFVLEQVFDFGDRSLVVAKDSGGTSCPELLAVIVVDAAGAHSPGDFGTCAETNDVKRVGDHLITIMHGFLGPDEPQAAQLRAAAERHVFIILPDGHVTDNGKPVKFSAFVQS